MCRVQWHQGLLIWRLLCKGLPQTIWHSNCLYSLRNSNVSGNLWLKTQLVYLNIFMHKITNLWKFLLNRSSKLRDNNERKKHPCHKKLCAFRCLTFSRFFLVFPNLQSETQTTSPSQRNHDLTTRPGPSTLRRLVAWRTHHHLNRQRRHLPHRSRSEQTTTGWAKRLQREMLKRNLRMTHSSVPRSDDTTKQASK